MSRLFIFIIIYFSVCISCKQNAVDTKGNSNQSISDIFKGKKLSLSGTNGWVLDPRFVISQPSNIISNRGYSYVFYTAEPKDSSYTGSGYRGRIHYAFSRDQGNTWSDQGLVINPGLPGTFDSKGVSKATVIKATDDAFFYLYYVGVGDGFNGKDASEGNRSAIGLAKLIFNDDNGLIRIAIKLNSSQPVLLPSDLHSGRFDAFRLDDPNAINNNGQIWLYYTGYDAWNGTARTGVAVSADVNTNHIKQNNGAAVLDGVPTLFQKQGNGVLAIFSDAQATWYSEDGFRFKKSVIPFPATVRYARGNNDTNAITWGMAAAPNASSGFTKWKIN